MSENENFGYRTDRKRVEKHLSQNSGNQKKGFWGHRGNKIFLADLILIALIGLGFYIIKPMVTENKKFEGCAIKTKGVYQNDKIKILTSVTPDKIYYYKENLPNLNVTINYEDKKILIENFFQNPNIEKTENSYDLYTVMEKNRDNFYQLIISNTENRDSKILKIKNKIYKK